MKTPAQITDPGYYPPKFDLNKWLPTTMKEIKRRGWTEIDVILFSGDAYVDHPSFGAAVIGRVLENMGLKVALVPQPNWQDDLRDFKKLGEPKLFFGITAGNMDSMINHYTAAKRIRSTDAYTAGNLAGSRPDRALSVYAKILRDLYPDSLIIAGGIEASLRRLTHYDFWADQLHPSVLAAGDIDILNYGMGEQTMRKIVTTLKAGGSKADLQELNQIAYIKPFEKGELGSNTKRLASHEKCIDDKIAFAKNFAIIERASNQMHPKILQQQIDERVIVVNPPEPLLTEVALDDIHDLPFTRLPHPKYWKKPLIPAFEMIRFSINIHRGCFGGCSFCTISAHQGKFIQSRSLESIHREVDVVSSMAGFKGYLSDLGGPSANMYKMAGRDLDICASCSRASCIDPDICYNLSTNHAPLSKVYKSVRERKDIKKAFVGSGVRYDLFVGGPEVENKAGKEYASDLIKHHVSGRLKVAPEHTDPEVLKIMRKPSFNLFKRFKKDFDQINSKNGLKQQLIPYFISAHPGADVCEMAELAVETKDLNFRLQQVQDFTPTPMTLATVMFYTGINPYTLKPVKVVQDMQKKKLLSQFFFWYKKENQGPIRQSLKRINRADLIKKLLG